VIGSVPETWAHGEHEPVMAVIVLRVKDSAIHARVGQHAVLDNPSGRRRSRQFRRISVFDENFIQPREFLSLRIFPEKLARFRPQRAF